MSKKRQIVSVSKFDTPYQRMLILVVGLVVVIAAFFVVNTIVRGLGGNEKKLAEALVTTIRQPYINGQLSLAQQAQANTFDAKGTFQIENLKKISLEATMNGSLGEQTINLPVKLYGDLAQNTTYIHLEKSHELVNTLATSAPTIKSDLTAIADRIDGKWLRIKQNKNTSKVGTCTSELFAKLAEDQSAARELTNVYAGNRFIRVEGVKKQGDKEEYTTRFDKKSFQGFMKSLKSKSFFTSIKSCDSSYDPLGVEQSDTTATQSQQTQQQQTTNTTKITVSDGKIVSIVSVASLGNQVNTNRISLNFASGKSLSAPTDNIVEYDTLQPYMASLGRIAQQQQASQQNALQQQSSAIGQ